MNTPTIGREVHYILTEKDAEEINRRRTNGASIKQRIEATLWPIGAQAHIGNPVDAGDHVAAKVVAVFNSGWNLNLQCALDGNDQFWVTSRPEGTEAGTWHWPEREIEFIDPEASKVLVNNQVIVAALDSMAVSLAEYGHDWSEDQKNLYNHAVEMAKSL